MMKRSHQDRLVCFCSYLFEQDILKRTFELFWFIQSIEFIFKRGSIRLFDYIDLIVYSIEHIVRMMYRLYNEKTYRNTYRYRAHHNPIRNEYLIDTISILSVHKTNLCHSS